MQTHSQEILYSSRSDVFKIKPVFDTHLDSPQFDKKALADYLKDVDNKTYLILGGDAAEYIIHGDPRWRKSNATNTLEEEIDELVDDCEKVFVPYKKNIIAVGDGNHELEIIKRHGTNPGKRLAKRLGVKHLGESWMIRLLFKTKRGGARSVIIYGHHGYGGGCRTEGGSLTKYAKKIGEYDADIFLFGHDHEKLYKSIPQIYWGKNKIQSKDRYVCLCGCFKKNMTEDDTTTWEESKGFNARAIGGLTIYIKPGEPQGVKMWVES